MARGRQRRQIEHHREPAQRRHRRHQNGRHTKAVRARGRGQLRRRGLDREPRTAAYRWQGASRRSCTEAGRGHAELRYHDVRHDPRLAPRWVSSQTPHCRASPTRGSKLGPRGRARPACANARRRPHRPSRWSDTRRGFRSNPAPRVGQLRSSRSERASGRAGVTGAPNTGFCRSESPEPFAARFSD
jgi:hypothetical protein